MRRNRKGLTKDSSEVHTAKYAAAEEPVGVEGDNRRYDEIHQDFGDPMLKYIMFDGAQNGSISGTL